MVIRDHVEWDEEHEAYAQAQIERHINNPVPLEEQEKYYEEPAEFWNKFYEKNENRFFKDRHWLRIEFPELFETTHADASSSIPYAFSLLARLMPFHLLGWFEAHL